MKKKLFIGLACFAVMAAAAIVAISSVNDHTPELSDLLTQDIEALTQNEGGEGGDGDDEIVGPVNKGETIDVDYRCAVITWNSQAQRHVTSWVTRSGKGCSPAEKVCTPYNPCY